MTDTTLQVSRRPAIFSSRAFIPQVLVGLYLLITIGVSIVIPLTTINWYQYLPLETARAQASLFYIPLFTGLIFLICSLWIFYTHHHQVNGLIFSLFSATAAQALISIIDLNANRQFPYLWYLILPLTGAAIIQLSLIFPNAIRGDSLSSRLSWLVYIVAIPFFLIGVLQINAQTAPPGTSLPGLWFYLAFIGLAGVFFIASSLYQLFSPKAQIGQGQSRIILVAACCSFLPPAGGLLAIFIQPGSGYPIFLLIPLVIFPIIVGSTFQRYRFMRTKFFLSRVVLYTSLAILAVASYALLISGLSLILTHWISPYNPLIQGLIIFLVAISLIPVRDRLQVSIDRRFFQSERILQEKVQAYNQELTQTNQLAPILNLLRKYIDRALTPSQIHIFIYDSANNQYISAADTTGQSTSDIRFSKDAPLVHILEKRRTALFIKSSENLPADLEDDHQRIAILATQMFVPMPGIQRLTGWVGLGPRRSGEAYNLSHLRFLEMLANQSALAIEHAQVMLDMERRVREMNVLSRLSLGINVTVNFDDILELIYAQTNQVIPSRDFFLTLFDPETSTFQYAFYMENDERLPEKERKPLPAGITLEQEIIRTHRPLNTPDYQKECHRLGILPTYPGIIAWMGVPLNSGADIIGTISLGSGDPGLAFNDEQLSLLQSIADQTAGGIVKARLLQETERRARQLSILNDVTRQLTSTLETEPLFKTILQNAVDMLNCEAGSLLLVDDQTDELVFHVSVGPVAADLVGKRLPSGVGVVGKSYHSRQPVIVNNAQQSNDWYSETDEQTGYVTHAILATPLEVKEDVIGVIEVINRRDGQPFTNDDQSLLAAFASQASIAFENARLYTLTDQALTARVEELSVMQRIDRELNTSLEINKAMNITLDWAMRQSMADAGLVGIIEEQGIRIMASQGYSTELVPFENAPLPLELPPFQAAIQSGQLQQVEVTEDEYIRTSLLNEAKRQVIIPIRREASAIGLILLESTTSEPLYEETLSFLNRLSDHAAIAISNAQLYTAVKAANAAKSEFVSFVSHELKNPMTSIKGYTELIAAGAVGPVNEAQANFLSTIRSNVERMSTLVSDLADVSRIEAGKLRLDFKPLSAYDVTEEVIRSLRRQIEEKQQVLLQEIPADLPMVWADRTRLNQILTNLVNNAIKYTPANGQITAGGEFTSNKWNQNGPLEVVHIWVKDTGIGINADDQQKIFQKFFRSEDPKARESPGTGLGLNITKSLVELQGGQIWFESEYRKGTVFHFTIPVSE